MSERGRLWELIGLFGTLGIIGFGGPAAHIALMRREVVGRVPSVLLVLAGGAVGLAAAAAGTGP